MFDSFSSIVYSISCPISSYFGKSVNSFVQFNADVTVLLATIISPFFICNITLDGLFLALLLSSSHTFVTVLLILSSGNTNVFVIVLVVLSIVVL